MLEDHRQAEPPENVNGVSEAIYAELMSETPRIQALQNQVKQLLNLSNDNAHDFLYQTIAAFNSALLPPVTHLELIHTEGCNLGCLYCFEKDMLGYRRMSADTARSAVKLLFDYSANSPNVTIVHFGGEPTMNLPAIKMVTEYAENLAAQTGKTVDFDMTSNGVLITDEMAEYFAAHKIMVLLSIDGLKASHDRYRTDKRGRGTFGQVVKAVRRLQMTQKWVGVKMTVMPDNADRLYGDVLGLRDLGINQFVIGYATGVKWSAEQMRQYARELGRVHRWYSAQDRSELRIADFDEPAAGSFFGCQAGRNSITVSVDGEISPCSKILALNNKDILAKLGDVSYGLYNLHHRLELIGCSQLKKNCEEAGIAAEFQGGCFASNYEASKDLYRPNLQDYEFSLLERSACAGCATHR